MNPTSKALALYFQPLLLFLSPWFIQKCSLATACGRMHCPGRPEMLCDSRTVNTQVPFPPVPRRLLFPFSCVPFQLSSRPPILVPLPAPSASASLVAQRRRCARLPTPQPPTPPRAPPPLFILGAKPSLVAIHYRDSAFLSAAARSVSCRFAPGRGDAGHRFRHLLGCSRLYRLRLLESPSRLPNPSATMHFSEQY
jgi:hypothetical protein